MATDQEIDQIVGLYVSYFNRAPDPGGLQFWIDQLDGGRPFETIAADFAESDEAVALYPFLANPETEDPEAFITSIYQNLFNRDPDADGLAFWSGVLSDGSVPVGDFIEEVLLGAQDTTIDGELIQDATTVENKIEAARYFTEQLDDVDADFGLEDPLYNDAVAAIADVTADPSTVAESREQTDEVVEDASQVEGQEFRLTDEIDNLAGTADNDTFRAETAELTSSDFIDGGNGRDELVVFSQEDGVAQSPRTVGVETFVITNQTNDQTSTADNNVGGYNFGSENNYFDGDASYSYEDDTVMVDVELDAGRMVGTNRWEDYDSRADVVIEDARDGDNDTGTFTGDQTVAMVSTDPGNVDYAVYFDDPVNTSQREDVISLEVIDQNNSTAYSAGAIDGATTGNLTDALLQQFSFTYNGERIDIDLTEESVAQEIDDAGLEISGPNATYNQLVDAIQIGLDANDTVGGDLVASLSDMAFEENIGNDNPAFGTESSVFGRQIELTSISGAALGDAGAGDIIVISQDDPADTAQSITVAEVLEEELIRVKIELDDVGKGSAGGDLVVGAMSTGRQTGDDAKSDSIGIQQFDIHVDNTSWLQTINSTNNALEEVFIDNEDNDTARGDSDDTADGDLIVRGTTVIGTNFFSPESPALYELTETNNTMPGAVPQHNVFGFSDVRVIDASAMEGAVDLTAELTDQISEKYLNFQDGDPNRDADDVTFDYDLTGQNDEFFLVQSPDALSDAGTGSREDYILDISGNGGDDVITTLVGRAIKFVDEQGQDYYQMYNTGVDVDGDGIPDWYENHSASYGGGDTSSLTVGGGAGNDEIWTFGWGDYTITGGAGNDLILSDNSGVSWIENTDLNPVIGRQVGEHTQRDYALGAVWTFNDINDGAVEGDAGDVSDIQSAGNAALDTGATGNDSDRDYVVRVSYLTPAANDLASPDGLAYTSSVEVDVEADTNFTAADLNQAIKRAVNEDAKLSQVLEAQDGPGNSLLVYSVLDNLGGEDEATAGTFFDVEVFEINDDNEVVETIVAEDAYVGDFENFASASTAEQASTITAGSGDDVIALSSNATVSQTLRFDDDFGHDTVYHFLVAADPIVADVLDFVDFRPTAAATLDGALGGGDGSISIEEEDAGNDTAGEVAANYTGLGDGDLALAIVFETNESGNADDDFLTPDDDNTGTVYLIEGVDGDGEVANELGKIDLIGTDWTTLTLDNFAS